MTDSPSKISRFWNELKRRRVIHVVMVYASAAFVIIELVNNLSEPLNLPPRLATIVVIILAVGFPLAVILGWIYDLTPDGIERTKHADKTDGTEPGIVPNAWKIATYISFAVIAGLIALNIARGSSKLQAGDIESLVILPFENFTGDEELANMVSGMHSLLIGDMGRISGLRVIGRTSSMIYRKAEMTASEIAKELNVDAVVEGTVMCLADTICMQLRLVKASGEEEQLWIGDYSEDKSQFLNMYNRVTKQIADEVRIELTDRERKILEKDRAADRDVIDAYIQSFSYWGDLSKQALDQAEEYLAVAIQKDPEWAPLYGAMAILWGARLQMGQVDNDFGRKKLYENLEMAIRLDPDFTDSQFITAVIAIWTDWDWDRGEKELLQSLAVNPNHVLSRMYYAHLLMILQRMDEAMIQARLALELDPADPLVLALYSVILKGSGQHQAVLETLEKALTLDPGHSFTRGQLGRAYYNLGRYGDDLKIVEGYLSQVLGEGNVPDLVTLYGQYGRQVAYEEVSRLRDLCAKQSDVGPITLSRSYYRIGAYTKAIDELEKAYAMHDPNLPYIGTGTRYEALHDSARFLAILDNMGLPHPVSR